MINDIERMAYDYAECYADKSRIKFIEKYLSTFNASAGRMTPFILFPRQKVFLKSVAENPASIAIKHRQCRNYNHIICMDCCTNGVCNTRIPRNCFVHCQ